MLTEQKRFLPLGMETKASVVGSHVRSEPGACEKPSHIATLPLGRRVMWTETSGMSIGSAHRPI